MSSSNPTPPTSGQWIPQRPSKRSKLRNGTFIIPSTGERSRRQFTLRRPPVQADGSGNRMQSFFSRESLSERLAALKHNAKLGLVGFGAWLNSPAGRGVLKCTVAYTIASLGTFITPVSNFLGRSEGKHVVATITVYFHPARTAGSMIEAILIAVVAVAYALLIAILSMAVSVLVGSKWDQVALAHVLVLVVFICGGFGFLGWVKQKMNNPLVNVGGTLASLAIISVVTRENEVVTGVFSNHKVLQTVKVLIMGVLSTTAVNLLLWRTSAVVLVRTAISQASASLGDMLAMISSGFLSGSEEVLLSPEFSAAFKAYGSVYPKMMKNLRDAKFERYFSGHEKVYQLDRAVVKSIETLAQSIGALRSAANTQFALLKEQPPGGTSASGVLSSRSSAFSSPTGRDRAPILFSIEEASEEGASPPPAPPRRPSFRAPADIFELFISLLGPSMKSLAYTLSEVLHEPPFGPAPDYEVTINENFRHSLTEALGLFNSARAKALQELYTHIELNRARTEQVQADFEEVAAACGHFSFSLQAFGEEMQKYLDILDDLKFVDQHKKRSWHWLMWWKDGKHRSAWAHSALPYDTEGESLVKPIKKTAMPRGIPDSILRHKDTYNWQAADKNKTFISTISQGILRIMRKLGRDDVRFGVKVGLGAALWSMFAFLPQTRDFYHHWRGEWGHLSFMIVCSMTVGAANTVGWARLVGTLIGAAATVVNWNITQGNPIGLVFLGWLISFWSFWILVDRGKAALGRTTLLSYNVSTLYAYSISQSLDDDGADEGGIHPLILEIAKHRSVSVSVGILWGLLICRVVWPISARTKFKEGLSMLYLQMGLIWKRGPLAVLLRSDCSRSYLKSGEQVALQKYADRLGTLRVSAKSEFELRGPFPFSAAGRLMQSTTRILDAFYAMSLLTQRKGYLSEGERALLQFTASERAQLCDRICHVFQVVASSLMLEYPLTDAIPSVIGVRDRLLGKIFRFRKVHVPVSAPTTPGEWDDDEHGPANPLRVVVEEKDYALLYAYALVTGQVADELGVIEKEIEHLFGVLHEESLLLQ